MMSRTGHAQMRRALCMPALVALRHNAAVKVFERASNFHSKRHELLN